MRKHNHIESMRSAMFDDVMYLYNDGVGGEANLDLHKGLWDGVFNKMASETDLMEYFNPEGGWID